jgi:hypothetical protein
LVSALRPHVWPGAGRSSRRVRLPGSSQRGAAPAQCASGGQARWYGAASGRTERRSVGRDLRRARPWAIWRCAHTEAGTEARRRPVPGGVAHRRLNGPSKIGSSLNPASNDPDVTRTSQPPIGTTTPTTSSGTWFDVNGWLTLCWASWTASAAGAQYVGQHAEHAANHAARFPTLGRYDLDDVCYSFYRHPSSGNDLYRTTANRRATGVDGDISGSPASRPRRPATGSRRTCRSTPSRCGCRRSGVAAGPCADTFGSRRKARFRVRVASAKKCVRERGPHKPWAGSWCSVDATPDTSRMGGHQWMMLWSARVTAGYC